jgi:hypothetical protein
MHQRFVIVYYPIVWRRGCPLPAAAPPRAKRHKMRGPDGAQRTLSGPLFLAEFSYWTVKLAAALCGVPLIVTAAPAI